ncbi:alanine racemase [Treponema primitia ZAS-2]|uniref:Alanine racemase n=1 Tax=Treponema primitia (strain ATCC BAA-887 / DSM 12427 / ZAS-2) TaxID=545694 RepID=F5YMY2_TREPZ|nr:alanine racemase [Treponema primitia]AEF85689.1 alanine racemase [Treponema primitia ZAS-2]
MRATRALIHLNTFRDNIRLVRNRVGPGPKICAPVKADAYGHGAVPMAKAALEAGAAYLAVATVGEGTELRKAGIDAPILLLSAPIPEELPELVSSKLTPLVWDREFIQALSEAAGETALTVHLKLDTGMGRVGCRPEEAGEIAAYIAGFKNLSLGGILTHLAVSDSEEADHSRYTKEQLARLRDGVERVKKAGVDPGLVHAANTGGVAFHEDSFFDMVRPGILLYGYAPDGAEKTLPVKPVMELITQIVYIKQVKKGETVSYGRIWTADKDTTVATIPIGYGDGLPRRLSGGALQVRINGAWYPQVGRICMDQCMIDLGSESAVKRWDKVTLMGADALNAAEIAAKLGTISYEITCGINKRVPRVYVESTTAP